MLIILQDNIRKLGLRGSVVKVKPGYFRNFLFPQGKAVVATQANLVELEKKKAVLAKQNADEIASAKKIAEGMKDISLSVQRKANPVDGKLFGSVSSRDIASELEKLKIELSAKDISLPSIKQIGNYFVTCIIHPEVTVQVSLTVEASKNDS